MTFPEETRTSPDLNEDLLYVDGNSFSSQSVRMVVLTSEVGSDVENIPPADLQPDKMEAMAHVQMPSNILQPHNKQNVNMLEEHSPESDAVPPTGQSGGDIHSENDPAGPSSGAKTKFGGPPGFLNLLIGQFRNSIVKYLDWQSQEAILGQKVLEDPAKFAHVKLAVSERVLDLLLEMGDGKTVPGIRFFENIVDVLGTKYPSMFAEDPYVIVDGVKVRKFSTRGTGGVNGIRGMVLQTVNDIGSHGMVLFTG